MSINYNIPVELFDFKEEKNSLYSAAKLKIFYVGTTGDGRKFTQQFSDRLLETLPYVPVVGYYNEDSKDFEGHKPEVQYIYGIVPDNPNVEYIEEDSRKYAISDVILYTGRLDKTGDIAKKIVGKSHSLELNPADTKYKINKDKNGKVIDLEFTEGSLLGLSVLGDGEAPAFTGSEFFKANDDIEKIFKNLKDFAEKKRGENMKLQEFKEFSQFIQRSYREEEEAISEALLPVLGDHYIRQMFDDHVIVTFMDEKWDIQTVRIEYTIVEEEFVFGVPVAVIERYYTVEEIEQMENLDSANEDPEVDQEGTDENSEGDSTEDGAAEFKENADEAAEFEEEEDPANSDEEGDPEQDEEDEENEERDLEEGNHAISLSEGEREELEALRKEVEVYKTRDKKALIESFNGQLGLTFLEDLSKRVEEFSLEELEITLAKEFTRIKKENAPKGQQFMPFANKTNSNSDRETHEERMRRLVRELK